MPLRNGVFMESLTQGDPQSDEDQLSLATSTSFCSCMKPGCFSFNAAHSPNVVILCDCSDGSVHKDMYLDDVHFALACPFPDDCMVHSHSAGYCRDHQLLHFTWQEMTSCPSKCSIAPLRQVDQKTQPYPVVRSHLEGFRARFSLLKPEYAQAPQLLSFKRGVCINTV